MVALGGGAVSYGRGAPVPRGNALSLRGVASAERHALHPRGACLVARLCRRLRVQGVGLEIWGLGLNVKS